MKKLLILLLVFNTVFAWDITNSNVWDAKAVISDSIIYTAWNEICLTSLPKTARLSAVMWTACAHRRWWDQTWFLSPARDTYIHPIKKSWDILTIDEWNNLVKSKRIDWWYWGWSRPSGCSCGSYGTSTRSCNNPTPYHWKSCASLWASSKSVYCWGCRSPPDDWWGNWWGDWWWANWERINIPWSSTQVRTGFGGTPGPAPPATTPDTGGWWGLLPWQSH